MSGATERCANCGESLAGRCCSHCGQPRVGRLSFGELTRQALRHVVELEGALPRTFLALWRDPGRVGREYIAGRRTHYFNPVKYTLILLTVFVVVINLLQPDMRGPFAIVESEQELRLLALLNSIQAYMAFVYMLPVALIQRLLFRKDPYNVAECYAFQLYATAQISLVATAVAALDLFSTLPGFLGVIAANAAYRTWAVMGLYRSFSLAAAVKGLILFAAGFITTNTIAVVIGNLIIRLE